MKVEDGKRVTLDYELSIDGGDVIESSAQTGPIEYVHGTGKMLPALEQRINGLVEGDDQNGIIPAAEAYGTDETLPTRDMRRSEFPSDEPIEVGKRFEAKDPAGRPINFVVVKIQEDRVTIRFDHPLSGKDIRYQVKVLKVANPTPVPPPPPIE